MTPTLRLGALCLLLILSGCVSTPKQHYSHPSQLSEWQLQGKLALQLPGKAQSAYFTWKNSDANYDIRVNGPLGQGAAHLIKDGMGVTLQFDGQEYQSHSPEQLMQDHLGWSFPVRNMNWWIKGLSAPESTTTQEQYDEQGRLQELQQQGWKIRYVRYQPVAGLQLPYKIIVQGEQLKLTLLLKKWRLGRL